MTPYDEQYFNDMLAGMLADMRKREAAELERDRAFLRSLDMTADQVQRFQSTVESINLRYNAKVKK